MIPERLVIILPLLVLWYAAGVLWAASLARQHRSR